MSKIRYTFYVSACVSDHACAYVGQATHACIEAIYIYIYIYNIYVGPIVRYRNSERSA